MENQTTEQKVEILSESLHQALVSAWLEGYEMAQKDISGEIDKLLKDVQTAGEQNLVTRASLIALWGAE